MSSDQTPPAPATLDDPPPTPTPERPSTQTLPTGGVTPAPAPLPKPGTGTLLTGGDASVPDEPDREKLALPGYEVLGELGRGGMGVVYKARQTALNRLVALKMILHAHHAGAAERQRFRREAEAAARLQHPHVVQIHEIGEHQGLLYFSQEFCPGGNLAQKLGGKPLPVREAAMLAEKLARALQVAHQAGLVHRDLKPANVLLGADGQPKIADFGLAKILDATDATQTQSGAVVGSPSYMAPEQARGQVRGVGPPADIYALGAILYELLTGRPPFQAATVMETLDQVVGQEPVPPRQLQPKTPRDLETICLKCLAKDPRRRYAHALALADDLSRFLDGRPTKARPVGRVERLWRACRRRPALSLTAAVASAAVLSTLALLVGLAVTQDARARDLEAKQQELERALGQANSNFRDGQRQYALLALDRGLTLCEDGDAGRGLLFLAAALEHAVKAGDERLQLYLRRSLTAWRRQRVPLQALLPVEPGPRRCFAVTPSGALLAAGQGGVVRRWQAATGLPLDGELKEPDLTALVLSPDGAVLATADKQGLIRLRDPATLEARGPTLRHRAEVLGLAFSPNGEMLASAGADGTARLWETKSGRPLGEPLGVEGSIRSVAFTTTGTLWAVVERDGGKAKQGEVWLWDAAGKPLGRTRTQAGPLTASAVSPDGKVLLTAAWVRENKETEVRLWSTADGRPLGQPLTIDARVLTATFHPRDDRVLLGEGSVAALYELAVGEAKPLRPAKKGANLPGERGAHYPHQDVILAAAFSPDGKVVVTGSQDGTAQVWEAGSGKRLGESLEHQAPVHVAGFTPGGAVLTCSTDGRLRVWDWRLQKPNAVAFGAGPVPSSPEWRETVGPKLTPQGRAVYRPRGDEGRIILIDLASGHPAGPPLPHHGPLSRTAFSLDGRKALVLTSPRTARAYEVASGRAAGPPLEHRLPILALTFGPDGATIVTGGGENDVGEARIWDASGRPQGEPLRHAGPAYAVAVSPDGRSVLTGSWDQTARLWDARSGRPLAPPLAHDNAVTRVLFGPDGRSALTLSADGAARLCDASTGQLRARWFGNPTEVKAAAYSPDGKRIATASANAHESGGEVRVWDAAMGEPVGPPMAQPGVDSALAFSPDGTLLLVGGDGFPARLWDAALARPLGPPLLNFDAQQTSEASFTDDGRDVWVAGPGEAGHTAIRWPTPAPIQGEPERLRLWAQLAGGLEFDAGGGVLALEPTAWLERRGRLGQLGGPPATEPTMTAPLQDRRRRLPDLFGPGLSLDAAAAAGG